jgi:hypothetical protein
MYNIKYTLGKFQTFCNQLLLKPAGTLLVYTDLHDIVYTVKHARFKDNNGILNFTYWNENHISVPLNIYVNVLIRKEVTSDKSGVPRLKNREKYQYAV